MAVNFLKSLIMRSTARIAKGLHILSDKLVPIKFLPTFLFAFLVIVSALLYFSYESKRLRIDSNRMLSSIADLKIQQISSWRNERLADARYLQESQEIRYEILTIFPGNTPSFGHLKKIIKPMMTSHGYNRIQIYSARGRLITAEPDVTDTHDDILEKYFLSTSKKIKPEMSELELDRDGNITLHMIIPLHSGNTPVGFIVMCIDPHHELYPLIMSWPVPSRTSESLLVMRTGNEIVYLNELRHRKKTALRLRFPVSSRNLPAAKAIRGQTGIIEGIDYRGVQVIAEARAIPHSSWYLIVKIDKREIYAPIRNMTAQTIIVAILLILGFGAISRNWQFKRELALNRKIRENREMYDLIAEHTHDVVWILDLDEGFYKYVSPSVERLRGYTVEEIMTQRTSDMLTEESFRRLTRVMPERIEKLRRGTGGPYLDVMEQPKKDGGIVWVEATIRYFTDKNTGHILVYGSSRDITERKKNEDELRKSEERFSKAFHSSPIGLVISAQNGGRIMDVNRAFCDATEFGQEELIGSTVVKIGLLPDISIREALINRLRTEGHVKNAEITMRTKSGSPRQYQISMEPMELGGEECAVSFIADITEQREYEEEREATIQILRIINSRNDMNALIHDFLAYMRAFSGCDAVGLRLTEGDDFPYFETQGFSDEFVMLENRLCAYNDNGEIIKDHEGNPVLECMCGNILRGRFDPTLPFFTEHGSFWSNCTSDLLATTTEKDRQARTRNRCNSMGYESVALIPVSTDERIVGLIQLNARKRNTFTLKKIHLFERLADNLASGIAKRQAESDGRESNERYSSLFENMLNGFAYCRMLFVDGRPDDFIYISVNRAFETLTGLKNVIGKKVSEVIPGIRESDFTIIERYGHVAITGIPETFEIHLTSLDMWFSVAVYSPEKDFFVSVFDVITERKRAEEALVRMNAELEERVAAGIAELSDLYNNAPCGYHSLDINGVYERINDTELTWLGYTREEIIGKKRATDILSSSSISIFHRKFPEFMERGFLHDVVLEMVRKDGTVFPILLNATAVYDSNGNFLHSRSTIVDYTERKFAEERLYESRKKLEEANRDLESFSYSVSHDLRAPLRGIDGWSLALLEEYASLLDDKGRSYILRVRDETKRMGELIDDLLQLSKVTRERLIIVEVDASALAMSVAKRIGESLPGRIIQFDIRPSITVQADARLTEILLTNLIDNACKFTAPRQTAVIEIGPVVKDGRSGFFVKDNGVGFDIKYSSRMFSPFQRLHKQSEFPGTGIGLTTVKRIVSRHGGDIWFETAVDKGFSIYIVL
jgi:PAS domain S-box-containing protein